MITLLPPPMLVLVLLLLLLPLLPLLALLAPFMRVGCCCWSPGDAVSPSASHGPAGAAHAAAALWVSGCGAAHAGSAAVLPGPCSSARPCWYVPTRPTSWMLPSKRSAAMHTRLQGSATR
jgi:hypothetical protein